MSVVAATRFALSRDWLASWIHATNVRADGTTQSLWIARPIRVHVFEIVQLIGRHAARRAVSLW